MNDELLDRDRAIQALKHQIHHERVVTTETIQKKAQEFDLASEDVRTQNDELRKLNEDLKKENEAHFASKIEINEKISELEHVKIES